MTTMKLAHGLQFQDLYTLSGLHKIDDQFLDHLAKTNIELQQQLERGRAEANNLNRQEQADIMLALAPEMDRFIGELFGVSQELNELSQRHRDLTILYDCKHLFVQRRAAKAHSVDEAMTFDGPAMEKELTPLFGGKFDQFIFAEKVMEWLEDKDTNAEIIELATCYIDWALYNPEGQERHKDDLLFRLNKKVDHFDLVPSEQEVKCGIEMKKLKGEQGYNRDGFTLTDKGDNLLEALDESTYCVICHHRGRDSCSHGAHDKKTGEFSKNPLNIALEGCPLEERISEMHEAKNQGFALSALAIIIVDNPMVAATGHRICNDCMKACIFQKQQPVNIPQAETRTLKDILELPWGFEIYALLTRWNPLNFAAPLPKPESGYNVLVVGAGPAGFSLSHYLMNEGHKVTAIDGLKIEPLAPEISGIGERGKRVAFEPIYDITNLQEDLDERSQAGFGGVAEYGITVRWDKNFLKILRLLVERRQQFDLFGGVRFGSAITAESAYEMGFDHIALCMGAGKPTFLNIPNGLARGVRQASDFLMALQLTGAAKKDSVANLQLRLPAVVIGGGLTAIDTATEALAYYVRQVEKFLDRYEVLITQKGEEAVRAAWNEEEQSIADEFLPHGRAIRAERELAAKEGREPRFIDLLNEWGGATIAYRRLMTGSPSYQLNHEEIEKAFEQGIYFAELLSPTALEVDKFGHTETIKLERQEIGEDGRPKPTGEELSLPARAVLIAAGTQPNTVLAREHPGFAELDGKYFQAFSEEGDKVTPEWSAKPKTPQMLIKHSEDGRTMSYFGDLHPSYAGNVVKAIASAKQGYPVIDRMLKKINPSGMTIDLNKGLRATVKSVSTLVDNVIEITVHAPLAAKAFKPGQFFRLQNYEADSLQVNGTTLAMEGVALTGALVDPEKGLVSLIAMDMGGSTSLISYLKPGQRVILMGPTGAPTETPGGETVLLAGGGLGNAVLLDINTAFRQAGSKVLYFAAYKGIHDRFHIDHIEEASDVVVWCCDTAPGFKPSRPQDKAFVGNIVQAMTAYAKGELGDIDIPLSDVDRMIVIGSDMMMRAVGESRHGILKEYFKDDHVAIASINSPMQCMMKEICAQCLQPHKDPETGKETVVFSCFNQDQPIDRVNFPALRQRLCQNAVHEKLTAQWISYCKESLGEKAKAG
ncbi:MAG: FAD-dependent oxidoreductase [Rhodospirillales bacterium]|nr:FAD-dependent oxidoreductase [Rhodospirillales bacterium]